MLEVFFKIDVVGYAQAKLATLGPCEGKGDEEVTSPGKKRRLGDGSADIDAGDANSSSDMDSEPDKVVSEEEDVGITRGNRRKMRSQSKKTTS